MLFLLCSGLCKDQSKEERAQQLLKDLDISSLLNKAAKAGKKGAKESSEGDMNPAEITAELRANQKQTDQEIENFQSLGRFVFGWLSVQQ